MLIKFEKENCPDCEKMNAIFDKYELEPDENIVINEFNLDVAKKYKVTVFPTLLFTSDEDQPYEEYERLEGLPKMSEIKKFLCV